jgi:hypothetical protein
MRRSSRHIRSLVIALVVLALSAGAVLAGRDMPASATFGLDTASEASGKTVPVGPASTDEPEEAEEADEAEEAEEVEEVEEAEEDDPEDVERPANHGAIVSAAAQAETPDGFKTHGEYVSSIARGDEGKPAAASKGAEKAASGKAKAEGAKAKAQAKAEAGASKAAAARGGD